MSIFDKWMLFTSPIVGTIKTFGVLVSIIWLLFIGEWRLILFLLIFAIVAMFAYKLLLTLITMIFIMPAIKIGNKFFSKLFLLLTSIIIFIVSSIWLYFISNYTIEMIYTTDINDIIILIISFTILQAIFDDNIKYDYNNIENNRIVFVNNFFIEIGFLAIFVSFYLNQLYIGVLIVFSLFILLNIYIIWFVFKIEDPSQLDSKYLKS